MSEKGEGPGMPVEEPFHEDVEDMEEDDEAYTVFLYPMELEPMLVQRLKRALWALDHGLFAYDPGENRTRTALERAFEILRECSYFITILTPKSAASSLQNQFFGYALADEKQIIAVSLDGAKGMGMMSFAKTLPSTSDHDDIISAVVWSVIEEDGLDNFTFACEKCKEEDCAELPGAGDILKWQRGGSPIEAECSSCERVNRFNPRTLLPI